MCVAWLYDLADPPQLLPIGRHMQQEQQVRPMLLFFNPLFTRIQNAALLFAPLSLALQLAVDAACALAVYFGESSSGASAAAQEIFAALACFARLIAACDVGVPV